MSIIIAWDDETKTVIRYSFDRCWTWAEFFEARDMAHIEMNAVQHKVGVIMDAPPDTILPPNVLANVRSALQTKHPNTCMIVFLIHSPYLRAMFNTAVTLARRSTASFHMTSSLDEARALIAGRLPSLSDSPK
jgi:hypothetical protein